MYKNYHPTNGTKSNVISFNKAEIKLEELPSKVTNQVLFKHFMDCLVDIAKQQNDDLTVYHLKKASESYNQIK